MKIKYGPTKRNGSPGKGPDRPADITTEKLGHRFAQINTDNQRVLFPPMVDFSQR